MKTSDNHDDRTILRTIAAAYRLTLRPDPPIAMGGAINRVLRVPTTDGEVAVRVHRPETAPARLAAVHQVQHALRENGLPIPALRTTPGGNSFIAVSDRLVEVMDFIPDGHEVATWDDATLLLTTLGRFHGAGHTIDTYPLPPPPFPCYIEPSVALASLSRSLADASPDPLNQATLDLLRRIDDARLEGNPALPRTLAHGDFVGYNVLLGEDRVLAILDFDRLSIRRRAFDLAYTLLYVLSRLVKTGARPRSGAEHLSHHDIHQLAHLLTRYEAAADWPLAAEELRALPFEIAFAAFFPLVTGINQSPPLATSILTAATDLPLCLWIAAHAPSLSDALR